MLDPTQLTMADLRPVLDLILEHKMAAAGAFVLSSGIGAQLAIRLLNLLPLAWWYATVETVFYGISVAGGSRFTRPLWDPVEEWFEAFMGKTVDAARRGLRRDNGVPPAANKPQGAPPGPLPPPSLEMQADSPSPLVRFSGGPAEPRDR